MTDETTSPLRRRMIEDMTVRKLAPLHSIEMHLLLPLAGEPA